MFPGNPGDSFLAFSASFLRRFSFLGFCHLHHVFIHFIAHAFSGVLAPLYAAECVIVHDKAAGIADNFCVHGKNFYNASAPWTYLLRQRKLLRLALASFKNHSFSFHNAPAAPMAADLDPIPNIFSFQAQLLRQWQLIWKYLSSVSVYTLPCKNRDVCCLCNMHPCFFMIDEFIMSSIYTICIHLQKSAVFSFTNTKFIFVIRNDPFLFHPGKLS